MPQRGAAITCWLCVGVNGTDETHRPGTIRTVLHPDASAWMSFQLWSHSSLTHQHNVGARPTSVIVAFDEAVAAA